MLRKTHGPVARFAMQTGLSLVISQQEEEEEEYGAKTTTTTTKTGTRYSPMGRQGLLSLGMAPDSLQKTGLKLNVVS